MKRELKEILGDIRSKQTEFDSLVARRKELKTQLQGHRDVQSAEFAALRSEYDGSDEKLVGLMKEMIDLRSEAASVELEGKLRALPMASEATEDERLKVLQSEAYRSAFFRSLSANKVAEKDAEIMEFGKRAVTDVNGGSITSGGEYLLPVTTVSNIHQVIEEYGRVWAKVTKYGFTGIVSLPIGSARTETSTDGIVSLAYSFTETTIKQEAIVATIEVKNLILKNSIAALENFLVAEIGKYIGVYLDNAVINGDQGSFVGILEVIAAKTYTSFSYDTICDMQGDVDSPYGDNAIYIMRRSMFFKTIKKLKGYDNAPIVAGFPIAQKVGNVWFIEGQEVVFTNVMQAGDVLYGDIKNGYVANISQDTMIERNESEKFSTDKTVFRGKLYGGGSPISDEIAAAAFTMYVISTDAAAAPTANPAAGAVASGSSITLASTTTGATIYYTLDGSTPTRDSAKYSASNKPKITEAGTLKAIAVKTGMADSTVLSAAYTLS